jgi:ADP-heptose:LPS heptosyltransferase
VRLHLSADKASHKKRVSFEEVISLFDNRKFDVEFHEVYPTSNMEFQEFLQDKGIDAQAFYYKDHPGWREKFIGVEVSGYLREIPLIRPPVSETQSKVITSQWDTTGQKRKFSQSEINLILEKYKEQGYQVITVGGEAKEERYRESLWEVGRLMSRSAFHVGVDSGFMHLAQLFLPPERIHVYSKPTNYWAHHLFRGIENGMSLNINFKKLSTFEFQKVAWRYDSPRLLRAWHVGRRIMLGKEKEE